jgi:Uma2 family endonuclease
LVVEVADATLAEDQGLKLRVYARAGIPVYWIVNVNQRKVEVHSRPTGTADDPAYAARQDYVAGSELPVEVDGKQIGTIAVAELLP